MRVLRNSIFVCLILATCILLAVQKPASNEKQAEPPIFHKYFLAFDSLILAQADLGLARKYLDSAAKIIKSQNDTLGYGLLYLKLSEYKFNKDQYDSALYYNTLSRPYFLAAKRTNKFENTYQIQSYIYLREEQYFKAILSLDTLNTFVSPNSEAYVYSTVNAAEIYYSLGTIDSSISILKKSSKITLPTTSIDAILHAKVNLSGLYLEIGELDSCKRIANQTLEIIKDSVVVDVLKDKGIYVPTYYLVYSNLGNYYYKVNDFDKAYKIFKDLESWNFDEYSENIYHPLWMGSIALKLNKLDEAEKLLRGVNSKLSNHIIKDQLQFKKDQLHLYKILSELYEIKGDYKKSLKFKQMQLDSSQFSEQKRKQNTFQTLSLQNEKEKLEKERLQNNFILQTKQNEIVSQKRKNDIILFICLLLVIGFIASIYYYKNQKKKREIKIQELQQQNKIANLNGVIYGEERERKRLADELHDNLNGNLSVIKYSLQTLANPNDSMKEYYDQVIQLLDYTIDDLRNISHYLSPPHLEGISFKDFIVSYCRRIETLSDVKIDAIFIGEELKINQLLKTILYRITQELIQNVIKHSKANKAMVQYAYNHPILQVTVEDNGIGFNPEEETQSLGLQNIRTRVNSLKGNFDISSDKNGTSVCIEIDLRNIPTEFT